MKPLFRYRDGVWPHSVALGYGIAAHVGGVSLLVAAPAAVKPVGVLLLAHGLVILAYLIHECAHNTIFLEGGHNAALGEALNWLVGGCYGRYEDLRAKHFRHHLDRADVVAVDYRRMLVARPRLRKLIEGLEWAWIPAVELMMHALMLWRPFMGPAQRGRRRRVAAVLALRVAAFAALGWWSPVALLGYAAAYLLFLTVLRYMDAHQHTYEVYRTLEGGATQGPVPDRAFEQRNTFSNLISRRFPRLNLLTLNFAYHNAHHARPTEPWYRLPALHRELYGAGATQVLSARQLLPAFHRHRVARVMNGDAPDSRPPAARFVGVDGVSFLTAF